MRMRSEPRPFWDLLVVLVPAAAWILFLLLLLVFGYGTANAADPAQPVDDDDGFGVLIEGDPDCVDDHPPWTRAQDGQFDENCLFQPGGISPKCSQHEADFLGANPYSAEDVFKAYVDQCIDLGFNFPLPNLPGIGDILGRLGGTDACGKPLQAWGTAIFRSAENQARGEIADVWNDAKADLARQRAAQQAQAEENQRTGGT